MEDGTFRLIATAVSVPVISLLIHALKAKYRRARGNGWPGLAYSLGYRWGRFRALRKKIYKRALDLRRV